MDDSTTSQINKTESRIPLGINSFGEKERWLFGQNMRLAMSCIEGSAQPVKEKAMPSDETAIRQRLKVLSQDITSSYADLLELLVRFDDLKGWQASGASHCAAWMNFEIGISMQLGWEYLRVGRKLRSLPTTTALFRSGKLSLCLSMLLNWALQNLKLTSAMKLFQMIKPNLNEYTDSTPTDECSKKDDNYHAPSKRSTIKGAGPIAHETARRIACDCSVTLNTVSNGEPVDIGRKSRIWPNAMARAIKDRDQHCQWPGCSHTQNLHIHHIKHWADGGHTSVSNAVSMQCPSLSGSRRWLYHPAC